VENFRHVVVYRMLAILGFFLVLFLKAPLSLATLSLIEPLLIGILLSSWVISFYVRANLARRPGAEERTPIFRRLLPGHILVADGLKLLFLALGVLIVWTFWSLQPLRIFNATVLVTLWTGLTTINALTRYRGGHPNDKNMNS
jgi:hypothetical protein